MLKSGIHKGIACLPGWSIVTAIIQFNCQDRLRSFRVNDQKVDVLSHQLIENRLLSRRLRSKDINEPDFGAKVVSGVELAPERVKQLLFMRSAER